MRHEVIAAQLKLLRSAVARRGGSMSLTPVGSKTLIEVFAPSGKVWRSSMHSCIDRLEHLTVETLTDLGSEVAQGVASASTASRLMEVHGRWVPDPGYDHDEAPS